VQGVVVDVGGQRTAAHCEAGWRKQWASCVDNTLVCEVSVGCGVV
jgi:hypothetical protein